jgi:exonuclease III
MSILRTLAYNINGGGQTEMPALYEIIHALNPDLVSLTEADNENTVKELAEQLELYHVWAEGSGTRHVGFLSRFPIVEWKMHKERPLTQAALAVTVQMPDTQLTVYTVHLLPYPLLPIELRRWQATGKLLEVIRQRPSEPSLIMGDLNGINKGDGVAMETILATTAKWMKVGLIAQGKRPYSYAIPRLIQAGYTDCFRQLHPEAKGYTYRLFGKDPIARFDYVLANAYLAGRLRACQTVDDVGEMPALLTASDHFPVMAEFDF